MQQCSIFNEPSTFLAIKLRHTCKSPENRTMAKDPKKRTKKTVKASFFKVHEKNTRNVSITQVWRDDTKLDLKSHSSIPWCSFRTGRERENDLSGESIYNVAQNSISKEYFECPMFQVTIGAKWGPLRYSYVYPHKFDTHKVFFYPSMLINKSLRFP